MDLVCSLYNTGPLANRQIFCLFVWTCILHKWSATVSPKHSDRFGSDLIRFAATNVSVLLVGQRMHDQLEFSCSCTHTLAGGPATGSSCV